MTREEARNLVYGNPEAAVELIFQLSEAVEILQARVAELERKIALLTRDSSNSSKPPSSDGPGKKPQAQRPKKSRKRNPGGQPGHKGTKRQLAPIEEVDHVEEVLPALCESCHKPIEPGTSSDCFDGQALSSQKGCFFLSIALRITTSFRMQATSATLPFLPDLRSLK